MTEPQESNGEVSKRKWPKKRKTFLSNAKKYARKGQLGRGTKMSEDMYQYFVGILEVMKKGVETEDEKMSLVSNVLERTRGEEVMVVGNQLGCRVVELLLAYATPQHLETYMEALTPELRRLCADNFSSHVIEKLITVSGQRATEHLQTDSDDATVDNEDSDSETPAKKVKTEPKEKSKTYPEEHIQKCHDFTIKMAKYALNNMEDFVYNNYANHISRSVLRCLSGITLIPGEKLKKNVFKDVGEKEVLHKSIPPHTTKMKYRIVPQEFKDIAREFAERLSMWPQFKDMPYKNLTSGLVQILLYAVKNVDKNLTKKILRKLLDESFAPESPDDDVKDDKKDVDGNVEKKTPPVFDSEPAIRCLEAALLVAKKKTYTQIYARCFIGQLARAVTRPSLNFTVQRLIDNCQVKEEFEMMFDELTGSFGAVLACGNTGVLVALVKACERLKARQTQFLNVLESSLGVSEPAQFPGACLRLLPGRPGGAELPTNIHGSLVLQSLLHFQRPTKVVAALLSLPREELTVLLCDAKGCHVADAYYSAPFVGAKSRDKLVAVLKGSYQELAMSKYGSRAFEVIYEACSMDQKVKIMEELSEKGQLLNGSSCGRLLAEKLQLHQFRTSRDKWRERAGRAERTRGALADILPKQEE